MQGALRGQTTGSPGSLPVGEEGARQSSHRGESTGRTVWSQLLQGSG